jgi:hypothetical protein
MAMTLGIDYCKWLTNGFIAEAYKRKAGLGILLMFISAILVVIPNL